MIKIVQRKGSIKTERFEYKMVKIYKLSEEWDGIESNKAILKKIMKELESTENKKLLTFSENKVTLSLE